MNKENVLSKWGNTKEKMADRFIPQKRQKSIFNLRNPEPTSGVSKCLTSGPQEGRIRDNLLEKEKPKILVFQEDANELNKKP